MEDSDDNPFEADGLSDEMLPESPSPIPLTAYGQPSPSPYRDSPPLRLPREPPPPFVGERFTPIPVPPIMPGTPVEKRGPPPESSVNPAKRQKLLRRPPTQAVLIAEMIKIFQTRKIIPIHKKASDAFRYAEHRLVPPAVSILPTGDRALILRFAALHLLLLQTYDGLQTTVLKADYNKSTAFNKNELAIFTHRIESDRSYANLKLDYSTENGTYDAIHSLVITLRHQYWCDGLLDNTELLAILSNEPQFAADLVKKHREAVIYHCYMISKSLKPINLDD